ncbi:hypothetical protein PS385_09530 [Limosilactobacillus fermentum]|uniref:hypothetical protein n=1 Tax=Limosilactobacillus fermentum TaxID=1613 RepID=UPI002F26B74B
MSMMANLKEGTYKVVAKGYENNSTPIEITIADNKITAIKPNKNILPGSLEEAVFTRIPEKIVKKLFEVSIDEQAGSL